METKFNKILKEYTNAITINSDELKKRIANKLKTLDPQSQNALNAVTGAVEQSTETKSNTSMDEFLIDKLKDPNSRYTSDEIKKLEDLMTARGIQFKKEQEQKSEEDLTKKTTEEKPEKQTSFTYSAPTLQ